MSQPQNIAQAYIDTWNALDDTQRQQLMARHWADDARYVDPMMQGDGPTQIASLVGAVHQRFPGFRFRLTGTPDGYGDVVRLSWSLGPEDGEAPIEGSDVVCLSDGRIRRVIGFIDRVPAA
jgi:hypothetical protein